MLSKAGGVEIAAAEIEAHVAAGAPAGDDGAINLLHFTAWLLTRVA